jgi:micrococcal nuclease
MKKRNAKKLLIFLIILLIAINYNFIDSFLESIFNPREPVFIDRVIDGDTVEANENSIRLLGINTPEKGEPYYEEAKEFLESIVLNKTVYLEYGKERYDKYNRILGYLFLEDKSINIKLIENGFANYYFPSGKDKYYSEFKKAWENCNKNLCEKSIHGCSECIKLQELDYKNEIVILKNICSFDCDLNNWQIKEEGRKSLELDFVLYENKEKIIEFENMWTDTGDTLFLRDEDFKLVLWHSY